MCTAISYTNGDNYFGRNLDLDMEYETRVVVTPREYQIKFTNGDIAERHYAMIGSAVLNNDYPLYFEATNEKGLSCAALNFSGYAQYKKGEGDGFVASFEFILWVLSLNETVSAAKDKIKKIKISDIAFSEDFKPTGLHFIISDKTESITVEQTASGLNIYENKYGVLTNNPEFRFHKIYLENFAHLSPKNKSTENPYSNGIGAFSLPGDFSSISRFVKAVFVKEHSVVCEKSEKANVAHFFHILDSVSVPSGSVITNNGWVHKTIYSSCCNTKRGVFYYKFYNDLSVKKVSMNEFNLDEKTLILC